MTNGGYAKLARARAYEYRMTRTTEHKGIIDYLIRQPPANDKTILVNHNDYLALANHPSVLEAQFQALSNGRHEVMMSGVFLNHESYQFRVEKKFARFVGKDSAAILQSGFCANLALMEALCTQETTVYIDQRAHASFWAGLYLKKAKIIPFRHNNMQDLERKVEKFGSGLILVDSVYSAHGSIAPLQEIVAIKKRYDCLVVVDESHSLGMFGAGGAGMVAAQNLSRDVDYITASLSKAFSTRAGIVLGDSDGILLMLELSYPSVFSSAIPNYDLARIDTVLNILPSKEGDGLRERLFNSSRALRQFLMDEGFVLCCDNFDSPIISIYCGEESCCRALRMAFDERNIYLSTFFQPATPPKDTLLRMTVNSSLRDGQVNRIKKAAKDVKHYLLATQEAHPSLHSSPTELCKAKVKALLPPKNTWP